MASMNFLEKMVVNSWLYNWLYRPVLVRNFLGFCELRGRCLEIGCGPGFTTLEILKRFAIELTAIDLDREEIERAKKLFGKQGAEIRKPEILQADAARLPFKGASFDCVIEMNAFHHISEYRKAIGECRRVLKKGGRFYMLDISRYFLWPFLLLIPFEHFDGKFTRDSMAENLEAAGFRIIKKKGWDVFMIAAEKK